MNNTNTKRANRWNKFLCAAVAAGAIGVAALPASAGERRDRDRRDDGGGVRIGVDLNLGGHREPRYEERRTKVWVEPVYRTVTDQVFVEPTFHTVSERVWRRPVVKVQVERVWVPDRYEERTSFRTDRFGIRVRVTERVLVERAHYEDRENKVVVQPGHWETVEREVMETEGHFDAVERRELVSAGHFEYRTERVRVDGGRRDTVVGLDWDLD